MPSFTPEQLHRMRTRDHEWAAALLVLETLFAGDGRVWRHVAADGINFPAMLAEGTFSGGEACMLAIAGNIFNGSTDVYLGRAFAIFSDEWAEVATRAMMRRRGR